MGGIRACYMLVFKKDNYFVLLIVDAALLCDVIGMIYRPKKLIIKKSNILSK